MRTSASVEDLRESASHRRAGRELGRLQLLFAAASEHRRMHGRERDSLHRPIGCQSINPANAGVVQDRSPRSGNQARDPETHDDGRCGPRAETRSEQAGPFRRREACIARRCGKSRSGVGERAARRKRPTPAGAYGLDRKRNDLPGGLRRAHHGGDQRIIQRQGCTTHPLRSLSPEPHRTPASRARTVAGYAARRCSGRRWDRRQARCQPEMVCLPGRNEGQLQRRCRWVSALAAGGRTAENQRDRWPGPRPRSDVPVDRNG